MKSFQDIFERAAKRHGGEKSLEKKLSKPLSPAKLRSIPDDRWLSEFSKSVFQAGFVWRVVENKWPDFESIFNHFDLVHCAYLSDEDLEALTANERVIRHLKKLQSIRANANFLLEKTEEFGGVGKFITSFGAEDYCQLLFELKSHGSRLGGTSAQYCLRRLGVDSYILTQDVIRALQQANIITKHANSKRDLLNVQAAFNYWRQESGLSLTELSRILALSVD